MTDPKRPKMPPKLDASEYTEGDSAAFLRADLIQEIIDEHYAEFVKPLRPFIEGAMKLYGVYGASVDAPWTVDCEPGIDTHYTYAMPPMPIEAEEPDKPINWSEAIRKMDEIAASFAPGKEPRYQDLRDLADRIEKYGVKRDGET
jgi:hypothetical protein